MNYNDLTKERFLQFHNSKPYEKFSIEEKRKYWYLYSTSMSICARQYPYIASLYLAEKDKERKSNLKIILDNTKKIVRKEIIPRLPCSL